MYARGKNWERLGNPTLSEAARITFGGVPDALDFLEDSKFYIPHELAEGFRLAPSTIIRLFQDEPGVVRHGHPTTRKMRRYYSLRIPGSVAKRVFARMTVPARGRSGVASTA
jgi:hypothetical protein